MAPAVVIEQIALDEAAKGHDVFGRYRDRFSARRTTRARALASGDWGGLCSLRRLRLDVIAPPVTT